MFFLGRERNILGGGKREECRGKMSYMSTALNFVFVSTKQMLESCLLPAHIEICCAPWLELGLLQSKIKYVVLSSKKKKVSSS